MAGAGGIQRKRLDVETAPEKLCRFVCRPITTRREWDIPHKIRHFYRLFWILLEL